MHIYLVRHGETDFNKNCLYTGCENDCDLNENGIYQSTITGEYFKQFRPKIDAIYSSPMKRTKQTTNIINSILKINKVFTDKRLLQSKKGILANGSIEISKKYENDKKKFYNINFFKRVDPIDLWTKYKDYLDIELSSKYQVEKKSEKNFFLQGFINDIKKWEELDKFKNIIIVSHAGILKQMICLMMNIPEDMYTILSKDGKTNCFISYLTIENGIFKMISPPNTYHLDSS